MNYKYFLVIIISIIALTAVVSATTVNLYPIHDGSVYRVVANCTFPNLTALNSNVTQNNATTTAAVGVVTNANSITNNYTDNRKVGLTFDLNSIPQGSTITSAYLRIVPSAKVVTLGTPDVIVLEFLPDNKLGYNSTDYTHFNLSNPLSGFVASSAITAGYEILIPLNVNGTNLINTTLPTRYISVGLVSSWDMNQSSDYTTWAVSRSALYTFYMSEQADTLYDPYLIVNYNSGTTTTQQTTVATTYPTIVPGNVSQLAHVSATRGETFIRWTWHAANETVGMPPVDVYLDENQTPTAIDYVSKSITAYGLDPKTPHYITLTNATESNATYSGSVVGKATASTVRPQFEVYFLVALCIILMIMVITIKDLTRLFLLSILTILISLFSLLLSDGYGSTQYIFLGILIVTGVLFIVNVLPKLREQIDWF
jgi:hypothetical protein